MARNAKINLAAGAALIALALLAGCNSAAKKQQQALAQAKAQAASTNMPQAIQYIDNKGESVTTVVQPPSAGQAQQVSTSITPPPPGPLPHSTDPVITPLGFAPNGQPATGQPTTGQPGTTAANAPAQPGTASNQPPPLNLTVPAGTEIAIRINQNINVKHSYAGEHFTGEVVEPVVSGGAEVIPRGTPVRGRIDEAHRRGHFKGRSILELRLVSMTLNGYEYNLDTHDNVSTKRGKGKRTAGFIGGLTGAGMIVGGIASGGVGLAVGAASGAGAGTLFAGATGNRDIDIPAESIVHFRLADQLVVQNP